MSKENLLRALLTVSFAAAGSSLVILSSIPPASGFELSLLMVLPPAFWLLLLLSVTTSLFALVLSASRATTLYLRSIAVLALIVSSSIVLLLPHSRGYLLGVPSGQDALFHIGEIRSIISNGYASGGNSFPLLHMLGTSIILMASPSPESLWNLFPVIFHAQFLMGLYVLGQRVGAGGRGGLAFLAAGSPFVFSYLHKFSQPHLVALYAIPLLLYFWHRRESATEGRAGLTAALLIFAFFITFTHPLTAIAVIVIFTLLGLWWLLAKGLYRHRRTSEGSSWSSRRGPWNLVAILSVTTLSWYLSFTAFLGSFRSVVHLLIAQEAFTLVDYHSELLATAAPSFLQAARVAVLQYGVTGVYVAVGLGLATIVVLRSSVRSESRETALMYSLWFFGALAISLILTVGFFSEFNLIRVLRFPALFAILLVGIALSNQIEKARQMTPHPDIGGRVKTRSRWSRPRIMAGILTAILVSSVLTLHGSELVLRPNEQVTRMEVQGMMWFLQNANPDLSVLTNVPIQRHEDFLWCVDRDPCRRISPNAQGIPTRLGYVGYETMSSIFGSEPGYLITTELDRVSLLVFPADMRDLKVMVYLEEDFDRLARDSTANLLYSNGEFDVWGVVD